MTTRSQVELPTIDKSLEVEQLDPTLFRSSSLHRPWRARGVFGGHVISQSLVSASRSVDPAFHLHSMHCYFLLSASPAISILYYVEKLRDGKTYVTRSVKAVQNGKIVFIVLCSFQRPEPGQPSHQLPLPMKVPAPEKCENQASRYRAAANEPGLHPKQKALCIEFAEERDKSNIEVLSIPREDGTYPTGIDGIWDSHRTAPDGTKVFMWWMRARGLPPCEPAMQKCILGYISDSNLLGTVPTVLGLKRLSQGSKALGMLSSLDHSIYYYNNDFSCADWMLFVMTSSTSGSGRGLVHGRMYTREGTLVAVLTQEGVVRRGLEVPKGDQAQAGKAKL